MRVAGTSNQRSHRRRAKQGWRADTVAFRWIERLTSAVRQLDHRRESTGAVCQGQRREVRRRKRLWVRSEYTPRRSITLSISLCTAARSAPAHAGWRGVHGYLFGRGALEIECARLDRAHRASHPTSSPCKISPTRAVACAASSLAGFVCAHRSSSWRGDLTYMCTGPIRPARLPRARMRRPLRREKAPPDNRRGNAHWNRRTRWGQPPRARVQLRAARPCAPVRVRLTIITL